MRLVMTLLVRDEEDVIEANLDFHLAQGVDFVIVTDNGSEDATPELLRRYVERGEVEVIHEPQDDYSQARWVTRMARRAAVEHGADWVINADADEFWWPASGTLATALEDVADEYGSVVAWRTNFTARWEDDGPFYERMTVREVVSTNPLGDRLPPKLCHRAHAEVEVAQGNHGVSAPGLGRALDDGRIEILHFPMRSYRQFENKIVKGGAAYRRNRELPQNVGRTWRKLYERWAAGGLPSYYAGLVPDGAELRRRLTQGELAVDTRLRDFFHTRSPRAADPRGS